MIKDSTVVLHQDDDNKYITVYEYTYTDTLAPVFMIDYSGLFGFSPKSHYLIREAESSEHGILYRYRYDMANDTLVRESLFWDLFNNLPGEVFTQVYIRKDAHV